MEIASVVRLNIPIKLVRLPDSGEVYSTDSGDYSLIKAYVEADGSIWIAVFKDVIKLKSIVARIPASMCIIKY